MALIKAHPTRYRNTLFRSRLEARWAAFFDLAGWQWQYEPNDYAGWVPDFALIGRGGVTLVEVKPIEWVSDAGRMLDQAERREDLKKVRAITDREVLVLGAYPVPRIQGRGLETPALGVIWAEEWQMGRTPQDLQFDQATLWRGTDTVFDFSAADGSYRYRISDEHDGDHHLQFVGPETLSAAWARANALTQWKP